MQIDNSQSGPKRDEGAVPRLPGSRHMALAPEPRANPLSVDLLAGETKQDSDEIDLLAYWRILVKRRWLVLGVLAAALLASVLLTLMATPMYRSTAVLQIDNQAQQVVQEGDVSGQGSYFDYEFLETQIQLMRGRDLAERVADSLDLDDETMDRLNQPSWLDRLKDLIRPAPKVVPGKQGGDPKAQLARATGVVRGGLSIEPVKNTRLVRVHYDSPIPSFAARVAGAFAESYIAWGLERRMGATSYAKTYLENQIALLKSRLEDSERELVAFAQKENLVSNSDGQSLASQNLSALNAGLATAQEQRIRTQARWQQAQAASGAALPADMLAGSILRTLQEQRATLMGTYQQKSQVLLPEYPEMRQIKGQLDDLDKQIEAELANIRASIKAEFNAASAQESLLTAQLNTLRTQALDVDGRSIRYTILKREVDTNRSFYDGLLQRYKEVGVAGDVRTNNVAIVERAQVPGGRFKPSLSSNLLKGFILGLVLGLVLAFVLEFLDDTIKTPQDVEQRLKLAVLGIIPKIARQSPAQAMEDPRSAFAEAYRSVRTALQFSTSKGVPKSLLITSSGPGDGKSTTALTLARNFASLGKRVLLIEGDLRNPSLKRSMGIQSDVGLSNLLSGAATISEAVVNTDDPLLDVILSGPLPPNPTELLSGSKLMSLLSVAGEHYGQIIIDGPPILGLADAPILSNAAGGTLMVVHSGKTKIHDAQVSMKRLQAAHAHLLGSLLTHYDSRTAGYGYKYEAYYSYGGPQELART